MSKFLSGQLSSKLAKVMSHSKYVLNFSKHQFKQLWCFFIIIPYDYPLHSFIVLLIFQGGLYLLDLVDYSVSGFPLLIIGVLEVAALAWIYGYEKLSEDYQLMLGFKPSLYFKWCWIIVTPAVIIVSIVILQYCW